MSRTKVVFLYTEIAGYFLSCVNELSKSADVLVVRWPVNKEAPFKFEQDSAVTIIDKKNKSQNELLKLVHDFMPDILVCSGWVDKDYLKIVKSFKKKMPCVLTLDNHWIGSIKQRIAAATSNFYLKKLFTHAWVPGEPQAKFAAKLGFGKCTLKNFYCADTALFDKQFNETFSYKKDRLPHRFLFVARYVKHKGIFELWEAFVELQNEFANDWELLCLGTGEEWENRIQHEKIRHIGFVQPTEMKQYIEESSVYILPSKFEPWGVSVQEFAVSGFPLLLSDAIGSKEKFLNENGYIFKSNSKESLKEAMKKIIQKTDVELVEMGLKSHVLGMSFTPADWAKNILSLK